uniref:HDC18325 n=1 Tax=Drosophila melanogaster TaxID=7227 RepID=Q6IIG5_DROME|nr:TPA_inf: HDC18325 [Drosophila melanogaster]
MMNVHECYSSEEDRIGSGSRSGTGPYQLISRSYLRVEEHATITGISKISGKTRRHKKGWFVILAVLPADRNWQLVPKRKESGPNGGRKSWKCVLVRLHPRPPATCTGTTVAIPKYGARRSMAISQDNSTIGSQSTLSRKSYIPPTCITLKLGQAKTVLVLYLNSHVHTEPQILDYLSSYLA